MPYANSRNGKLHYEVVDHVPPWQTQRETIIFHHGIGADPGIWWRWLPALMDRYRIVVFDMRGYGRSYDPSIEFDWTFDLLASDVLCVADAVGAETFHLVGESIGGTVVLQVAISHPERVTSLTVSNGAHLGASIQRAQLWREQMDKVGMKGWSEQFMKDRFFPGAITPEQYAWYTAQQASWPRDSVLNALSALIGADIRDSVKSIGCPVLLLHADSSPFIPVQVMADLHLNLGNSRFKVFPHAKHGLPFSHAIECSASLRDFLDRDVPRA